jgi:2'-5' RNA ligase
VRAFIAFELGPAVRSAIAGLMTDLRDRFAGLSWARPESVHLTLRFLGESSAGQIERLRDSLGPLAAGCPRAESALRGLGVFPERGRPSVLWLGVELPEPLVALQAGCEAAAMAAGFPREPRPFSPHLTLGRWRDRAARPELPAADLGSTWLETLVLLRSELRPEGALYTPLHRFDLGA